MTTYTDEDQKPVKMPYDKNDAQVVAQAFQNLPWQMKWKYEDWDCPAESSYLNKQSHQE